MLDAFFKALDIVDHVRRVFALELVCRFGNIGLAYLRNEFPAFYFFILFDVSIFCCL